MLGLADFPTLKTRRLKPFHHHRGSHLPWIYVKFELERRESIVKILFMTELCSAQIEISRRYPMEDPVQDRAM
jgi:hypothetical protein